MKRKDEMYIDPALDEDRFDFNEEPLEDDDIEKSPEGGWKE